MKNPKKGQTVIVYDRYRFALPLRALVVGLSTANDGVQVQLMESNNSNYPVGCDNVWISRRQLRKVQVMEEDESPSKEWVCYGYKTTLAKLGVPSNYPFLSSGYCEELCNYIRHLLKCQPDEKEPRLRVGDYVVIKDSPKVWQIRLSDDPASIHKRLWSPCGPEECKHHASLLTLIPDPPPKLPDGWELIWEWRKFDPESDEGYVCMTADGTYATTVTWHMRIGMTAAGIWEHIHGGKRYIVRRKHSPKAD